MSTIANMIERQAKTSEFLSRARGLRLVRRPKVQVPTALGSIQTLQDTLTYSFEPNGELQVREGQDVLADGPEGEEQDAITWLRAHPLLNDVFHEVGREPDRPLPTEEDFMASVAAATRERDPDALALLIEQEESSHGRQVLLLAAENARQSVAQALAEGVGDEQAEAKRVAEAAAWQEAAEATQAQLELVQAELDRVNAQAEEALKRTDEPPAVPAPEGDDAGPPEE